MTACTPPPLSPGQPLISLLLLWVFTHQDFIGLPESIAPVNVQRINRFMADVNSGKKEAVMKASYGNTYWFYFIFRFLNQQQ